MDNSAMQKDLIDILHDAGKLLLGYFLGPVDFEYKDLNLVLKGFGLLNRLFDDIIINPSLKLA